jgi:hypothetical protein
MRNLRADFEMEVRSMGSTENIVLAQPDDWEQWIAEIQAVSDEDIWPHIDPGHPAPERVL